MMAVEALGINIPTQNSQRTVIVVDIVFCAHPHLNHVCRILCWYSNLTNTVTILICLASNVSSLYIWHICVLFLMLFTTHTLSLKQPWVLVCSCCMSSVCIQNNRFTLNCYSNKSKCHNLYFCLLLLCKAYLKRLPAFNLFFSLTQFLNLCSRQDDVHSPTHS